MDTGILFATGMYVGFLPHASGVYGSLTGALLWYCSRKLQLYIQIILATFLFISGSIAAEYAEKILAHKDASPIVIDEIFGIYISLLATQKYNINWFIIMLIFVLFDSIKPFPVNWFDTQIKGGLGIMLDDMAAAVYTLLFVFAGNFLYRQRKQG